METIGQGWPPPISKPDGVNMRTKDNNKYKDIDCVTIKVPVVATCFRHPDKEYPAGSMGTVIDSYDREYLVEFPGDPSPDGFIYRYYEALMKEDDLELFKSYNPV